MILDLESRRYALSLGNFENKIISFQFYFIMLSMLCYSRSDYIRSYCSFLLLHSIDLELRRLVLSYPVTCKVSFLDFLETGSKSDEYLKLLQTCQRQFSLSMFEAFSSILRKNTIFCLPPCESFIKASMSIICAYLRQKRTKLDQIGHILYFLTLLWSNLALFSLLFEKRYEICLTTMNPSPRHQCLSFGPT